MFYVEVRSYSILKNIISIYVVLLKIFFIKIYVKKGGMCVKISNVKKMIEYMNIIRLKS